MALFNSTPAPAPAPTLEQRADAAAATAEYATDLFAGVASDLEAAALEHVAVHNEAQQEIARLTELADLSRLEAARLTEIADKVRALTA